MTSKERIRRILRHDAPDRLGWDFLDSRYRDIDFAPGPMLSYPGAEAYAQWGEYDELRRLVPDFHGELCMDAFGNILGRLNGRTKGECVRGVLEDGWEGLSTYAFPTYDSAAYRAMLHRRTYRDAERYIMGGLPATVFSTLRDGRRMANALMDTLEAPEMVEAFLERLCAFDLGILDDLASSGVDGVMVGDDWGTQTAPFISPRSFRALFAPAYRTLADACHERGMDFFLHSCGYVYPFVADLVEAGVDCFQFDQPELTGSEVWAREFGHKAAFYCPVDIQKVLSTGDRDRIESSARRMCDLFRAAGGSLIAKDYPSPADIGVEIEWTRWAMDVFLAHSAL